MRLLGLLLGLLRLLRLLGPGLLSGALLPLRGAWGRRREAGMLRLLRGGGLGMLRHLLRRQLRRRGGSSPAGQELLLCDVSRLRMLWLGGGLRILVLGRALLRLLRPALLLRREILQLRLRLLLRLRLRRLLLRLRLLRAHGVLGGRLLAVRVTALWHHCS
jgi:hypothetical protein